MSEQRSSPVWHPFTQHALAKDFPVIAGSDGVWLETVDSRRILDAISSWWVITHGHRHPRIVAAIKEAAERIDQVIFAGLTHEAAEMVAARLIEIAPSGLSHVFYSDSGSTAVEVALKMALGHWLHRGERRTRILALEHGYHGDTVGAMSAGARGVFNAAYAPLLFEVGHIPFPGAGSEQDCLDALERECRLGNVSALIVEPLVLGAGGMLIYRAAVLSEMVRICRCYGVLFIADEVMTGFGRTGTLFACEQVGVAPDIMCIAKGLTGGSLPLAATLSTPEIFESHFSKDRTRTLFHSSSYTANPIACAAARANLEIWRTEPVGERVNTLAARQAKALERFRSNERVENVRQMGTIAALDVAVKDGGYLSDVGPRLHEAFMARGILLRPLGNTVYIMPPYCIGSSELDSIYAAIEEVV